MCLAIPLNCVSHTTDIDIEKARWWAMYTYSYNCVCMLGKPWMAIVAFPICTVPLGDSDWQLESWGMF